LTRITSMQAYLAAAICGAGLWQAAATIGGEREAWDSALYWTVAYPLGMVVAGALGYLHPERPWRWGWTLMLAQAVVLAVAAASFGLLPLGLMMFSILGLPVMAVAAWGARMGRRAAGGEDQQADA
jgi:peptidoglycan/LPS O-acetylase OafA/YrhL